ncbi:MAG: hypothetical protein COB74_05190 [Shewanella sp.]|nr:MAG: hypothetical protein COB74_05190 [Shewanella sp.]
MVTNKQLISFIKDKHGFVAQTCWIADVKRSNGVKVPIAHNRISPDSMSKPCPSDKVKLIVEALKYYNMIR